MILVTLAYFPFFIFDRAYGCFPLPQSKEHLCAELQMTNWNRTEGFPNGGITVRNLTEFCESNSFGDASNNGLCENVQTAIESPYIPSELANNLTEFCNPDSNILRNEFRQRGQSERIYDQMDQENSEFISGRMGRREYPPDCNAACQATFCAIL